MNPVCWCISSLQDWDTYTTNRRSKSFLLFLQWINCFERFKIKERGRKQACQTACDGEINSFFVYQTLTPPPSAPLPSIWQIQLAWHEHYGSVYTPQPRSWQGMGRMGTRDISQTDTEAWHGGSSTWPVSWLQLEDPIPWQVGSVNCSSTLWSITASHLSSNITALYFHMPLHSPPSSAALSILSHWHLIFQFLVQIEFILYSFLWLKEIFCVVRA